MRMLTACQPCNTSHPMSARYRKRAAVPGSRDLHRPHGARFFAKNASGFWQNSQMVGSRSHAAVKETLRDGRGAGPMARTERMADGVTSRSARRGTEQAASGAGAAEDQTLAGLVRRLSDSRSVWVAGAPRDRKATGLPVGVAMGRGVRAPSRWTRRERIWAPLSDRPTPSTISMLSLI